MGTAYFIVLIIIYIFELTKIKENKIKFTLFLFFIISFSLVSIYQLNLLSNNKLTWGSDAEKYYLIGKSNNIKQIIENNPISTNLGHPLINSLFFYNSNNDIFNVFLLKYSNILLSLITLTLFLKNTNYINSIFVLLPGFVYILSKNFREVYIIFAILLFLLAYFFQNKRYRYFLLSIAVLFLFRDFFVFIFLFIILFIYLSQVFLKKNKNYFIKSLLLFIITGLLLIFLFYQFEPTRNTLYRLSGMLGSDYEGAVQNPLLNPLALTYEEVSKFNYWEYIKWAGKAFIIGTPYLILEPSPYNYTHYVFTNSELNVFDTVNQFITSFVNYLLILPFLINQTIIIYKEGRKGNTAIRKDLLFLLLMTFSIIFIYAISNLGQANYRTKFIILITHFFGIQLIRTKYNITELNLKRHLRFTLIFNIIAFALLFL